MIHDQIVQEDKAIHEELEKEVTRLDQREKELIQENERIKTQLAAAQEEKRMLLGRLHEIESEDPRPKGRGRSTELTALSMPKGFPAR